ncbi:MAG: hypothetical protein E6J71_01870 [Deltaproteobacteria bacterium]|nr:MAG: hypothetical protein E6J71_01870 [Deltaproteobacteria bacterium]
MAEDVAKGAVPAAVRQLLQERARVGVATAAPVAADTPADPETVSTPEQLSVAELREMFERRMYELLIEPETIQAMRRTLRSRNPKAARDMLAVILSALFPHQKPNGTGPARVTLISHIDRSGANTTATKIETPS